jgi:hypothetical protein
LPDSGATVVQKNDTREKLLILLDRKIILASTKSEKDEMRKYILDLANTLYSMKSGMLLVYECMLEYADFSDPLEFAVTVFQQFRECNSDSIPFHNLASAFIAWKEDGDMNEAVSAISV